MEFTGKVIFFCVVACLVIATIWGKHGLKQLVTIQGELNSFKEHEYHLEREIALEKQRIADLERGGYALEKNAREDLKLLKSDEIVYIVKPPKSETATMNKKEIADVEKK